MLSSLWAIDVDPPLPGVPDAGGEDRAIRFLNEARAVNLVNHSGPIQVFEAGMLPGGAPFLVMEHLDGESLRARLPRAPGGGAEAALRLLRQVASALAAAHDKGIVLFGHFHGTILRIVP